MPKLHGTFNNYALFSDEEDTRGVVIDTELNLVDDIMALPQLLSMHEWSSDGQVDAVVRDLAAGALADLSVRIVAGGGRMYTIPEGAKEEAKRALEWRKEHKRGGTPVGLNTARTLARGGQIGIQKIRHIAKYFPRHEVDKKAKGYKPGQDGYPSNGRIAWALWGGDTAWRWARAIVERENRKKKTTRAGGYVVDDVHDYIEMYVDDDTRGDIDAFKQAMADGDEFSPEFIARVRTDGGGIDRIYKVENDGAVFVWDDGYWDDLGSVEGDILTYDRALDEPYDTTEKRHIVIDPQTAMLVSARLQQDPFCSVSVDDLEPEETALMLAAMDEVDWEIVDRAMVAAGEDPLNVSDGDGEYTPEERSTKARRQVRDKRGRFAQTGSRVSIGDGPDAPQGTVSGINPDTQSVTVRLDDGKDVTVPGNTVARVDDGVYRAQSVPGGDEGVPLDTRGILAQPRAPIDRPDAYLPGGLPALTGQEMQGLLKEWPAWVKSQRDRQQSERVETETPINRDSGDRGTVPEKTEYQKRLEKDSGEKLILDAREHPMLKNFFKRKKESALYYSPITSAAEAPTARGKSITPATSDVQPMYVAVVSPDDPRAVLDLVSIVPASTTSMAPMTFKRVNGKWEADPQIMADLNSPTPPPVVPLHGDILNDVLAQVDGGTVAAGYGEFAQGGLDRNRGNAEKLRRYWLYGRGALKIRWNTPGDWTRCFRHLVKYMGPRAKGYCALRHKEATGLWTGDKLHRKMYGWGRNKAFAAQEIVTSDEFIARGNEAALVAGGASGGAGAPFYIPLVIPEGVESGDGRIFEKGAITIRELPLPLLWQIQTGEGHNGSVVVGRIDTMERGDAGIINARGVFDTSPHACEVERMVREGFMRGVSADLDQFEASSSKKKIVALEKDEPEKIGGEKITITKARVMAVTVVPKPAFEQCMIVLEGSINEQVPQEDTPVMTDGEYIEEMDTLEAASIVACGAIASSIPVVPPADWFSDPKFSGPTPLTVDEAGRVFGHIAAWNVDHIGMASGTKPPRSRSNYAYFHTGVLRVDNGKDVPVGQLTLAGGHASLDASAAEAVKHYDDTASAIADVHAGEDRHGIWVAGALRPGTTPEQVRAFRASAPSGDWRPIKGSLELVAVCQVNVPGFPIARARVAGGQVYALVAAGASVLAKLRVDPITELRDRIAKLEEAERAELRLQASAISERFAGVKAEQRERLAIAAAAARERIEAEVAYDELGYISMDRRRKLASEGKALPDGSYPIRNVEELKDAISAYGRGKPSKRAAIRRHIMKRARGLKRADLIPDKWREMSMLDDEDTTVDVDALRAKIASAQAIVEFADISAEARERLAKEGKALPDGSYPIRNVEDLKNAIRAYGRSRPGDRAKVRRHIMKRARQLKQGDLIPEEWKSASMIDADATDLRSRVASVEAELVFADMSKEARERLAAEGKALPDGSYPIRSVSDLKIAILASARAGAEDAPAIRAHIIKRAHALRHSELLPEGWTEGDK